MLSCFQPYLCRLILLPCLDFEGQEPMLRCYSLSLQYTAPAHRENSLDSHTPSHPCTVGEGVLFQQTCRVKAVALTSVPEENKT